MPRFKGFEANRESRDARDILPRIGYLSQQKPGRTFVIDVIEKKCVYIHIAIRVLLWENR